MIGYRSCRDSECCGGTRAGNGEQGTGSGKREAGSGKREEGSGKRERGTAALGVLPSRHWHVHVRQERGTGIVNSE
jgi:hypothetical protein